MIMHTQKIPLHLIWEYRALATLIKTIIINIKTIIINGMILKKIVVFCYFGII